MRTSGSPTSSTSRSGSDDNPVTEAVALVKTYVKQNTVDELKPAQIGRASCRERVYSSV